MKFVTDSTRTENIFESGVQVSRQDRPVIGKSVALLMPHHLHL